MKGGVSMGVRRGEYLEWPRIIVSRHRCFLFEENRDLKEVKGGILPLGRAQLLPHLARRSFCKSPARRASEEAGAELDEELDAPRLDEEPASRSRHPS
jgi:hypothetical protein